ncbi:hypothetical protein [Streptomyces acidiscabies]|uniref:Uncharacterized protein n=1 Tax=Streptomyces acidiscabies TaxID=42234 RepID=A0ABU4LY40_9ACTN|nr:hypothetical protein [Streptomyces acidiscabies]MDX3019919.1 hypothetical protein [Streptomyces acidiscabies]
MSDSILVRITLDRSDLVSSIKHTQVRVEIPEVARVGWLLPADMYHSLMALPWEEALREVFAYSDARIVPEWDPQLVAARQRVREWLAVDENRDAMHAAWFQAEARRHPVARELLAKVAELEEQARTEETIRPHRQMVANSQLHYIGKLELRIRRARVLHLNHPVAGRCQHDGQAWPCQTVAALEAAVGEAVHPCGCPKRFGRHAEGCPTQVAREAEAGGGDTLPAWLFRRFMPDGEGWDYLDSGQREYWEHEARAVRRAVERGGFKADAFMPQTERERWVAIADALNAAHAAGMPVAIDLDGTLTDHRMWSVVWDRAAERWTVAGYDDEADGIDRLIAPTQALQPEAAPPAHIDYRAQWDSVPLGLYSTPDAARAHCEDHARRDLPTAAAIDWVTDPEDGVAELHATVDGEQGPTGYTVVPLEVTSEYDEEADE